MKNSPQDSIKIKALESLALLSSSDSYVVCSSTASSNS